MQWNQETVEQVKLLIVGTEILEGYQDDDDTYNYVHHWLELDVPLFGSITTFDAEEKARIIYEEIPYQILRFTIEYFWQSEFQWQSDVLRKILNDYGEPTKN